MSLTKNLRVWREKRNITNGNVEVYIANVIEELLEICYSDKKDISRIQAEIMSQYFCDREPLDELDTLDAIQDIQVFSINEAELMGYDNELSNLEVFKEIDSRKQCPIQRIDWLENGAIGKWQKDKTQDKTTLYKADYERCKLL